MMRASIFRPSPLLLLAVALIALATLFAPGAQPAQAQTTTVWSATLTVWRDTQGIRVGCSNVSGGNMVCSSTTALTDDDFTYNGVDYQVEQVAIVNNALKLSLDKEVPSDLPTLNVGGTAFSVSSGVLVDQRKSITWGNHGLSWSQGDTVSLSLTTADPTPGPDGTTEYWSDTLAVRAVDHGLGCGYRTGQYQCGDDDPLTDDALTDDTFTYHGVEYTIELVHVAYNGGTLQLILDREPRDRNNSTTERSRMALNVGEGELLRQFLFRDAMVSGGIADDRDGDGVNEWTNEAAWVLTWTGAGLTWTYGVNESLSLVTLPVGGL